ncbi:saccharopine dehydrogenase family protein [Ornithinimicrobium pekingense]|uniref:Enoyl reductase n=1 Tax=Ornithinimicrobium pekingense TaxID=384677 RepID=A0ABQ2FE37_9MICO|nr:saccharopine dehydrogenase NADP-binding domain-containing protein [Ornithinimicrobium pekingense]GGK80531.1 enoyl reductase [Ornithinimicrobium pekingense]
MDRDVDVCLFGATGFVGRLVAEHLARVAPPDVVVALAGRSEERLRQLRAGLGGRAADWPVVVADSSDAESLRRMVDRARVVVSTVGPYQRHGIPLVEACAEGGTDYADLTGETLFVREAIERAHETARASGARLVVSCGFDSVPSDLAVHLLHRAAEADGAGGLTDTTLLARARGGVSGGTVDSMRVMVQQLREDPSAGRVMRDPEALSGGVSGAPGQEDPWRPFVEEGTGRWVVPFFMGPYNTRVVRRSHALTGLGYGPRFRYRELMTTGRGVRGAVRAAAVMAGLGALGAGLATPGLRRLVDRVLPAPGDGPSRERREQGWFRMETRTTTEDGTGYAATVAAQGDPGYAATSVMLGQAALVLLATRRAGSAGQGGVLTPAVAIGDELVEALREQGFTLEVEREQQVAGQPAERRVTTPPRKERA